MTPDAPPASRPRGSSRFLDAVERIGNRLPEPITLFASLCLIVVVASAIAERLGLQVPHPRDGTPILAVSLLTTANVQRMFTEAVHNFTGFAPLGIVLVTMIGMGVAEGGGLVAAALRGFATSIPRGLLTAAIVFIGVNANIAADAGIVVLPPLAALLFMAAGRHPLAGIAAGFAGVAGGFSANLLPSSLDALLVGLSQSALDASRMLPGYHVQVTGNWFFLVGSTFVLTAVGTWVTERLVEPRLGPWQGDALAIERGSDLERRGLVAAGLTALVLLGLYAALVLAPQAPLRLAGASGVDSWKPFFDSIVILVMLLFLIPGMAFGWVTGTLRSDRDLARLTGDAMSTMGTYIVLSFVAAQFVNWFAWSNLATILAVQGAHLLRAMNLDGMALMVGLVFATAVLNLFTSSASAKWATFAPVFVPMFLLLGFSPEGTQVIYRVGDSCTNIITPLLPYMPFILTAVRRYKPEAGMGTIIALMMPYALSFLASWTLLLLLWDRMNWAIGPGIGLHMTQTLAR